MKGPQTQEKHKRKIYCQTLEFRVSLSLFLPVFSAERRHFSTFHLLPPSLLLARSALSILIALVPSAGLIDQKGSGCSSMFAWLNLRTARAFFFLFFSFLFYFWLPQLFVLSATFTLSSSSLPSAFSNCCSVLHAPLHFNTFILGSIPENVSRGKKTFMWWRKKKNIEKTHIGFGPNQEGGKCSWTDCSCLLFKNKCIRRGCLLFSMVHAQGAPLTNQTANKRPLKDQDLGHPCAYVLACAFERASLAFFFLFKEHAIPNMPVRVTIRLS